MVTGKCYWMLSRYLISSESVGRANCTVMVFLSDPLSMGTSGIAGAVCVCVYICEREREIDSEG